MISFENDYNIGAHPRIIESLRSNNEFNFTGYGNDDICKRAKDKIRSLFFPLKVDVEFACGGTQTNSLVISTLLKDYEGVISCETGHIAVHESGAIEYSGHKVITLSGKEGKICPDELKDYLKSFYADPTYEHMVIPGMVYISFPTEYGTLYSKDDLYAISDICKEYGLRLYIDGARLGYGMASDANELSLYDLAYCSDVLYIGGTKIGAMFGEAIVFTKNNIPAHFRTSLKQRGFMLAKGWLLGLQFDMLFENGLYFEISRNAIERAREMKESFKMHGIPFYIDSPTNQIFVILKNDTAEKLGKEVVFEVWGPYSDDSSIIRFVTSFATSKEETGAFDSLLDSYCRKEG